MLLLTLRIDRAFEIIDFDFPPLPLCADIRRYGGAPGKAIYKWRPIWGWSRPDTQIRNIRRKTQTGKLTIYPAALFKT